MADTIYALGSAPGRAGIAVVRVSGPRARDAVEHLTGKPAPLPRQAVAARVGDIDRGLVLWFERPASFTGEDVAEFHVHGGRAIVDGLFAILAGLGLRPAEAGEFTRRAVENGKLDLTKAEAIADLVDAKTEAQRRQALRQYDGALADLYERWRTELIRATAWAEAAIDFAEEEIPADVQAGTRAALVKIAQEIQDHIKDAGRGQLIRQGIRLTVIGPPNAGKSSFVNALVRRDVAIVAETPGTTRDVIEAELDIAGYAVTVADTAGLREAAEAVEAEGVRRALARADASDLVLLLLDGSIEASALAARADLTVWNKADLPWPRSREGLKLSLKTGEGMDAVVAAVAEKLREKLDAPGERPVLTRPRHRHALEEALAVLQRALAANQAELMAEDLRLALRALGRITGRVDIEELLDVVFKDFCIGK